jgi:hypothetical protein
VFDMTRRECSNCVSDDTYAQHGDVTLFILWVNIVNIRRAGVAAVLTHVSFNMSSGCLVFPRCVSNKYVEFRRC